MEISELLLSWDEYNQKKFSVPYIFSVMKENQELVYFGARHSQDPTHPEMREIENVWNKFSSQHEAKDCIGIVENGFKNARSTREENIRVAGESGLLVWLAAQKGIPVVCFEPNHGEIRDILSRTYGKDLMFYDEVINVALQWTRNKDNPPFETYLARYTSRMKEETKWQDFDFSFDHAKHIHKELFGTDFNENDRHFFYHHINPAENIFITNQISRDMDVYRDTAIVKGIVDEWRKGKSIFVVYGSGHAVIQEPALKKLLS